MRVTCSGWMRRLWTFQENILAKKLRAVLGDRIVNIDKAATEIYDQQPGQPITAACYHHSIGLEASAFYRTVIPAEKRFSVRHLHLQGDRPGFYLAVLRPLAANQQTVSATLSPGGLRVTGAGTDDRLFFKREGLSLREAGIEFSGRYGAILRRTDSLQLSLLDGSQLRVDDVQIESDGPAVFLNLSAGLAEMTFEGEGKIHLCIGQKKVEAYARKDRSTLSINL